MIYKLITPDIAKALLKDKRENNYFKRAKIEKIKKMMIEGKWKDKVGTPIVIRKGRLFDGRHRLTAIVETGKSYLIPFEEHD